MIKKLIKSLKTDKDLWYGWQSNIAMAYVDAEDQYKKQKNKTYLNLADKQKIANNAANHFLTILTN